MNKHMQIGSVVEFQTDAVRGLFVKVPDGIGNFTIMNAADGDRWIGYTHQKTNLKTILPKDINWKMLGKSHSVSEEEVRRLGISFEQYMKMLYDKNITYDYDKYTGQWLLLIGDLYVIK